MKKLVSLAIFILMFSGFSEKATAQVYVQTYLLSNSVAKRADGLKKFYRQGELIKCHDSNQKTVFEMRCWRPDSTFLIYLPIYAEDGRRKDCCPIITLYLKRGKWRTDNMPENEFAYNKKESRSQVKIINQAIRFLSSKKFNPPTQ